MQVNIRLKIEPELKIVKHQVKIDYGRRIFFQDT